ncbi:hypothetical protein GCM10023196_094930 [Actinoallomurus vinaceus]|uniref:Uncharacterized protein n=1 Tax=Actinoallomurus vinaceus TaxID=1080074 RepID=A0ABP8URK3_9ACTN
MTTVRRVACGFLNRVPQVRILPGAPRPITKKAPLTSANAGRAGLRRVQSDAAEGHYASLSTGTARDDRCRVSRRQGQCEWISS